MKKCILYYIKLTNSWNKVLFVIAFQRNYVKMHQISDCFYIWCLIVTRLRYFWGNALSQLGYTMYPSWDSVWNWYKIRVRVLIFYCNYQDSGRHAFLAIFYQLYLVSTFLEVHLMFLVYPSWDVPTRVHLDSVIESFISRANLLEESSYLYFSVDFDIRTNDYYQKNTWKSTRKVVINFFRLDFFGPELPEKKLWRKMVSVLLFGTRS